MSITGFYIGHGVEARHFLLSGLVDKALEKGKVVLFTRKKINSPFLDYYVNNLDVETVSVNDISPNKSSVFIGGIIRALRNSRKRLNKVSIYSHFGGATNKIRKYDFLTGNDFIHYIIDFFARPLLTYLNYNSIIDKVVLDSKIDHLCILEYGQTMNNALASVCSKNNISIHVFVNTLKTVFINDFIPFKFDRLFCWSFSQATLYKSANPNLKSSAFKVTGSPFHSFLKEEDFENSQRVLEKYNLDSSRPIVVYPLIYEKVYSGEHLIIEKINMFFNSIKEENRPQLVLRRNPFEESSFLVDYVNEFENVIVFDHFWERNKNQNWSIQSKEGEMEWKALLHKCSLMISYPSMSIIESIICSTPVINIGFGENGSENKKLSHLVHAPFIKQFEKSAFVEQCLTFYDFKEKITPFLNYKNQILSEDISNSIGISNSNLAFFGV
jgi:hypothetical protein